VEEPPGKRRTPPKPPMRATLPDPPR
jgi:hypothetical protein